MKLISDSGGAQLEEYELALCEIVRDTAAHAQDGVNQGRQAYGMDLQPLPHARR